MEGVTRYRRAQRWSPAAADLQAFDGRYESQELGTVFEILPGKDGLVMRFERSPEKSLDLTLVERDTYMRSMMVMRFRRDGSGKVTGFDYGNPVVRNIRFTRLGEPHRCARTVGRAATGDEGAGPRPRLEGSQASTRLAHGALLAITLQNRGQPPAARIAHCRTPPGVLRRWQPDHADIHARRGRARGCRSDAAEWKERTLPCGRRLS